MNPPPPFQTIEKRTMKKSGKQRKEKRKEERGKTNNRRDAMVFGDNVRARIAARALPRTPTQKEEEEESRG